MIKDRLKGDYVLATIAWKTTDSDIRTARLPRINNVLKMFGLNSVMVLNNVGGNRYISINHTDGTSDCIDLVEDIIVHIDFYNGILYLKTSRKSIKWELRKCVNRRYYTENMKAIYEILVYAFIPRYAIQNIVSTSGVFIDALACSGTVNKVMSSATSLDESSDISKVTYEVIVNDSGTISTITISYSNGDHIHISDDHDEYIDISAGGRPTVFKRV